MRPPTLKALVTINEIANDQSLVQFRNIGQSCLSTRTVRSYVKHGILVPYNVHGGPYNAYLFHVASVAVRFKVWSLWMHNARIHGKNLPRVKEVAQRLDNVFGNDWNNPDGKPIFDGNTLKNRVHTSFSGNHINIKSLEKFVSATMNYLITHNLV